MSYQENQDDGIDFLECLRVIYKHKALIFSIIFIVVIVLTGKMLILPRTYQATALILVSPARIGSAFDLTGAFQDIDNTPVKNKVDDAGYAFSLPMHEILLKSNVVLNHVIDRLNLKTPQGQRLPVEELLKKISVRLHPQTNILQLTVQDSNADLATQLANIWAEEYIRYDQDLILSQIQESQNLIATQLDLAKKNYTEAQKKLAAFRSIHHLDLLESELTIKKDKLKSYLSSLLTAEFAVKTGENLFEELKKQIANESPVIVTSKAITDDALWQKFSNGDLGKYKLRSETINPIYQNLKKKLIDTETELETNRSLSVYLKDFTTSLRKDIDRLEKVVYEKSIELARLKRDETLYHKNYEILSSELEKVRLAQSTKLGDINLISPALKPHQPLSRQLLKHLILAGIIGTVFGLFAAFLKEAISQKPGENPS